MPVHMATLLPVDICYVIISLVKSIYVQCSILPTTYNQFLDYDIVGDSTRT